MYLLRYRLFVLFTGVASALVTFPLRAGIALVGATLMLITGMLSLTEAVSTNAIDYKTLLLLFCMMVVIGFLRLSGFFQRMTARVALRAFRSAI